MTRPWPWTAHIATPPLAEFIRFRRDIFYIVIEQYSISCSVYISKTLLCKTSFKIEVGQFKSLAPPWKVTLRCHQNNPNSTPATKATKIKAGLQCHQIHPNTEPAIRIETRPSLFVSFSRPFFLRFVFCDCFFPWLFFCGFPVCDHFLLWLCANFSGYKASVRWENARSHWCGKWRIVLQKKSGARLNQTCICVRYLYNMTILLHLIQKWYYYHVYWLNENCTWEQVLPSTFQVIIVYLVTRANKSNKLKTLWRQMTQQWHSHEEKPVHSVKLTAKAPENRPHPERKFIFQPSVFRCKLAVSFRERTHSCHCCLMEIIQPLCSEFIKEIWDFAAGYSTNTQVYTSKILPFPPWKRLALNLSVSWICLRGRLEKAKKNKSPYGGEFNGDESHGAIRKTNPRFDRIHRRKFADWGLKKTDSTTCQQPAAFNHGVFLLATDRNQKRHCAQWHNKKKG